jgi:hypothetical protein
VTIFVAIIQTKYEIMAVGSTDEHARNLAAVKALEYLTDVGVHYDSPEHVLEYLGCSVTEIELGSATFC